MRPPDLADQRFASLHLFAACRPGTDEAVAQQLAPGVHAVLLLDRAGWHLTPKLAMLDNITLLPLPACSPKLGAHRDRTIAMGPDQPRRAGLAPSA